MWSDILRRRWIVTKNHPEFWIPKIAVVAGILLCVRMAPFVCISGLLMVLSMNLWEREEDYLIPRSSKERKSRRIMESIYLSTIYSFVLLVHNLIFLYVLKDDFTVENGGYLLLTNLFVWVSAIVMGISLGVINRKERKTVPQKLWHMVNNLAGGFLLGQSFDFFVLKGKLYQMLTM